MTDILNIVFERLDTIDFSILLKCSLVSKKLELRKYWSKRCFTKPIYTSLNDLCISCRRNKSINDFARCATCTKICFKLINKTNVKKEWFLLDNDLNNLNTFYEYIPIFKKYATYYDIDEVISYSIYKYTPQGLRILKNDRDNSKEDKKHKRIAKVNSINPIFREGDRFWNICFYDYIQTGKESFDKVERRYEQYKNQYEYEFMIDRFNNSMIPDEN